MTVCADSCVRGPTCKPGRIFERGSIASQSQSTCFWLRSRVRSSSKQQVWEVQMAEGAVVQDLCVLSCTSEPGGDGRLSDAVVRALLIRTGIARSVYALGCSPAA